MTYVYDGNGRTTARTGGTGATGYQYNDENQLLKVSRPNGDTVEFTYNGDNLRTSKTVTSGGTAITSQYIYDGGLLAAETDAAGNTLATYTYDDVGAPISVDKDGAVYYYHYNGHGDVVALTDESGTVAATYEYDEWGNLLSSTGGIEPEQLKDIVYDLQVLWCFLTSNLPSIIVIKKQ